jgi:hypothetical protein
MRDETDHRQSMDAALRELQIKVGVGEAARALVLLHDNFAGFGPNSARNSPPQVPYSNVFRVHAAF